MGELGGQFCQILLDNGSMFCAEEASNGGIAANKTKVSVKFGSWIPLFINDEVFEILFKIVKNLSVNCLLGNNVFKGATICRK